MKPENAAELLAQPDIDGGLIGGASLDADVVPGDRRRGGMSRPVALVVLDGWGLAPAGPGNAVDLADTPMFDRIWATARTPRWRRPAAPSGCPTARGATPRSAI